MIFNMVAGGAALNFEIIGGTVQPDNPAENTIWVNTNAEITDWTFSATEPAAAEGMVWIRTGSVSPVAFNALKKNGIVVYPVNVKQYVSGAWVTKEAVSYQNGAWKNWITSLFNDGDQFTDMTGGWSNVAPAPENGGAISIGTSMVLNVTIGPNINYQGAAAVGTRNKIDLAGRTKIKAMCNLVFKGTAGYPKARLAINSSLITPQGLPIAFVDIPEGSNTVELDVSHISDPNHIIIGGISGDNGYTLTITQVTIE